eukprot:COSAG02_NODE_6076_length_3817_cov_1.652501_1_plen_46_part_10
MHAHVSALILQADWMFSFGARSQGGDLLYVGDDELGGLRRYHAAF